MRPTEVRVHARANWITIEATVSPSPPSLRQVKALRRQRAKEARPQPRVSLPSLLPSSPPPPPPPPPPFVLPLRAPLLGVGGKVERGEGRGGSALPRPPNPHFLQQYGVAFRVCACVPLLTCMWLRVIMRACLPASAAKPATAKPAAASARAGGSSSSSAPSPPPGAGGDADAEPNLSDDPAIQLTEAKAEFRRSARAHPASIPLHPAPPTA